jgi:rare lipoprotein A (peptidoglycan hydrolase)
MRKILGLMVICVLSIFSTTTTQAKRHFPDTMEQLIRHGYSDKKLAFQYGSASWYGSKFHGRKTASGERYNMNKMTAAHRYLPLGSKVRVTNIDTGKSIVVKVNDRGPYHGDRILDLSKAAARSLGIMETGTCNVKLERL